MRPQCHSIAKAWESIQVELHGTYSADRVLELAKYVRRTNWVRVMFVLVGTPVPCLLVTFTVDLLPLSPPYSGLSTNKLFFVREYYAYLAMTSLALHQFRTGVPVLPYPTRSLIRDTFVVAALTVATIYGLTTAIGFPLPFTILTVMGVWASLTLIAMAIQWAKTIRQTPNAASMLFGMFKLWLCDILLVFIYPPYFYIFTTLSSEAQMAYTVLLPVIKLFMRNLFARAVGHLGDATPELVVFNADVFGSLFVSYCMQSSPSFWTTLEIMVADVVMMGLALRDIERARAGLGSLEHKVNENRVWKSYRATVGYISLGGRQPTSLERASILLELQRNSKVTEASGFSVEGSTNAERSRPIELKEEVARGPLAVTMKEPWALHPEAWSPSSPHFLVMVKEMFNGGRIHPKTRIQVSQKVVSVGKRPPTPVVELYTRKVRQLLFMAEFLLLINYVEVIIPIIFSIYLFATYYLPNHEYYSVYNGMDEIQLMHTLKNVLLYCLLQLVSLLALIFMLKRMFGHSPAKHIAFVLEKQVDFIQISLIFWLFYNVQTSLQHFGYDYTFQFTWLSSSSNRGST